MDEDSYESVTCLACTQLHFVNRATGRVLGEIAKNNAAGTLAGGVPPP
jgi:hypothetical protein